MTSLRQPLGIDQQDVLATRHKVNPDRPTAFRIQSIFHHQLMNSFFTRPHVPQGTDHRVEAGELLLGRDAGYQVLGETLGKPRAGQHEVAVHAHQMILTEAA